VAEVAADLANLRVAWQWAVDQAKVTEIHKSVITLDLFFQMRSRYLEGAEAFAQRMVGVLNEGALAPFLYTISTMHCMTVSLAEGGDGLGTMWGKEKALELLARAGFEDTEVHQLPHDVFNYYYISKRKGQSPSWCW